MEVGDGVAEGIGPQEPSLPTGESTFKDELNLAEFPIAALTDRVPDGQTTLVSSRSPLDREHCMWVQASWNA